MISSIAVDREYAYTLDGGVITRHRLKTSKVIDVIVGPDHSGSVVQLMTTNEWLFALCDDGQVFRNYREEEPWEAYAVPDGTNYLSSNDTHVLVIANDRIYRRHIDDDAFSITQNDHRIINVNQIDHDEEFGYALVNGVIYVRKFPHGSWTLYYEQLLNIVEIAASMDFIYARNIAGEVWRTKSIGASEWEKLDGSTNIQTMAVASDHVDRLWMATGDNKLVSVSPLHWDGEADEVVIGDGWIVSDWITEDWIEVA